MARYPLSIRYSPLWSVLAGPCPLGLARACGQVRQVSEVAGVREGGAGKAAGGDGNGRGRTVINSAAVSEGMPGIGAEIGYFEAARR